MKCRYKILAAVALSISLNAAYAYNNTGATHSCDRPIFSEFQPSPNKYNQSFSEFSLVASANTTPTSINVEVSLGGPKIHFSPKELIITTRATGQFEVRGKLDRPVEHGFARVSVTAHSKPGCEKSDGFLVRIH